MHDFNVVCDPRWKVSLGKVIEPCTPIVGMEPGCTAVLREKLTKMLLQVGAAKNARDMPEARAFGAWASTSSH
ncbi:MAG TPA: hypothetical protein VMD28_07695 [Acidimicrobiales bacterium]|nr:hypothetical protein [Acidimicrobiales bacterium]